MKWWINSVFFFMSRYKQWKLTSHTYSPVSRSSSAYGPFGLYCSIFRQAFHPILVIFINFILYWLYFRLFPHIFILNVVYSRLALTLLNYLILTDCTAFLTTDFITVLTFFIRPKFNLRSYIAKWKEPSFYNI